MKTGIGIALLAFLTGLILYAPSDKVLALILPPGQLQLASADGSLARGSLHHPQWSGLSLERIDWTIRPGALLGFKLGVDLEMHLPSSQVSLNRIQAEVRKGFFSPRIRMQNLKGEVHSSALQPLLKLPYMPLSGMLQVNLDVLEIEAQTPVFAEGALRVSKTRWTLGNPTELGAFNGKIETEDGEIKLQLEDASDGKLDLDVKAQLRTDRSYGYQVQLKPKAETPATLVNQMRTLGRTDNQGWYSLNGRGEF